MSLDATSHELPAKSGFRFPSARAGHGAAKLPILRFQALHYQASFSKTGW